MSEESKNSTGSGSGYENTPVIENVLLDPISALKEKASKNLERIGLICIQDILDAFHDKDDVGRYTTVIEVKVTYWDPAKQEALWSQSKATTMDAEVKIEKSGGYVTFILQFKTNNAPDLTRIWTVLSNYGKESVEINAESDEIPVMDISAVPMILGGKFGLIATDPLFWCIQPSMPYEEDSTQIRILYQPDSVLFLRDNGFESEEVLAKVKSEMAAETLTKEAIIRKEMEKAEYKRQREAEQSKYDEKNKSPKHTFETSKKR